MKQLFILFLMLLGINCYAQDSSKVSNVIYIDVPKKMKINDKIFIENKSPYTVLQAVVVLSDENKTIGISHTEINAEAVNNIDSQDQ